MPLESVTYISDLVATNPVGATDPKSQGDDHIRAIKSALLTTFPSITGAVTATHTQLNVLATDGAGAGMLADIAAIVDPNADRLLGWDDSAGAVIGFSLVSGQLAFGDGTLGTGANVPLLNAANTFTSSLTIANTTGGDFNLVDTNAAANTGRWAHRNTAGQYELFTQDDAEVGAESAFVITRTGTTINQFTIGSPSIDEIELNATLLDFNGAADFSSTVTIQGLLTLADTGDSAGIWIQDAADTNKWFLGQSGDSTDDFIIYDQDSAATRFSISEDGTTTSLTATTLDFNGALSPDTSSAASVGYLGTPQNAQNGDYTLALTDMGKTIYKASGGAGETITIPANGSVAFPIGTIVRVVNNGGGALSIAITTDTLSWAGAGTTGTRTLGDHGVAILEKVASTEWFISGVGLT